MAWTTPRTWTTGEMVTADLMNTHVRDNLLETAVAKVTTAGDLVYASAANALARLGVGSAGQFLSVSGGLPAWATLSAAALTDPWPTVVVKPSDETVTSSTTLQNDNDLKVAVTASQKWIMEFVLIVEGPTAGDFKVGVFAPTSPTQANYIVFLKLTSGTVTIGSGTSAGGGFDIELPLATPHPLQLIMRYYLENGANAGDAGLTWAQNTSNGTGTKVKAGSMLFARQI